MSQIDTMYLKERNMWSCYIVITGLECNFWFCMTIVEEAVNEVKRQAMDEVQKAVAEAEQKAFEMIAAERAKMEKTLAEAKRKATEDAIQVINEQEDSSEVSDY